MIYPHVSAIALCIEIWNLFEHIYMMTLGSRYERDYLLTWGWWYFALSDIGGHILTMLCVLMAPITNNVKMLLLLIFLCNMYVHLKYISRSEYTATIGWALDMDTNNVKKC